MSDSRFHGVFSALMKDSSQSSGQAQGDDHAQGNVAVTQDDSAEETPMPVQAQIAVDLVEDENFLILKVPIAGVKLSDLDIDVNENVITIHGERKQTDEFRNDQYLIQELHWGEFSRSVTLPHAVNPAKVKATFSKDNVLKIFVPKEDIKKVKIVKINEGG